MKVTPKKAVTVVLLVLMLPQILLASLGGALAQSVNEASTPLNALNEYFRVEYFKDDNESIDIQYVLSGEASQAPQGPAKPDAENISYQFSGWQSDPPGMTTDNITGDVVFHAMYNEIPTNQLLAPVALASGINMASMEVGGVTYYEVKFIDHDGTPLFTQLVVANAAVNPEDPTRETMPADGDISWAFAGWVSETPSGMSLSNITSDVVFRATYNMIEMVPFIVEYELVAPDPSAHLPPTVIRYFHVGDTADINITAPMVPGYKPSPDPVVYNGVMGQDPAAEKVTVTYSVQSELEYTVRHWFETDDAVAYNQEPTPGDTSQFTLDSSLTQTGLTGQYGSMVTLMDRAKPGYTRMTQTAAPLTANYMTYDVYYKKNTYTLTYDSNATDATVAPPVTIKTGNKIILPTNPTRAGYLFTGWRPSADGTGTQYSSTDRMPPNDLTIYGAWTGTTVNYKLVHWVEKPNFSGMPTKGNMDDYIFYAETPMTGGTAGETVPESAITSNKKNVITPTGNVTYATYQGYDDTTILAGDGTTVINVYYNRIEFPFTFNPTNGTNHGTFVAQGLALDEKLTLYFKYEENLIGKWPYPESGLEPIHTSPATTKIQTWSVPSSNAINRRDMLSVEFLTAPNSTNASNILPNYTTSLTTRTYDLYYFEKLPHQSSTDGGGNNISRTVSSTVVIPDGIPGYSRDILGTTGHGSMDFLGLSFISCDHNIGGGTTGTTGTPTAYTKAIKSTLPSTQAIYEVYMKRNPYDITFDKNTSGSVTVPPKMSQVKYGLLYDNWPTATLTALANWIPGVSPTYKDTSGVTWVFENWHDFPEVNSVIKLDSTTSVPARNMTMYAHWKPQEVTVTLKVEGAVVEAVTMPAYSLLGNAFPMTNPTKSGYTFIGWVNGDVRYSENFELKSDLQLEAAFTPNPTSYTVRYLREDGLVLRPDYTVNGMHVDDKIRIPYDEAPPAIAGFTLLSTEPALESSLTLVEDGKNNIITFRYKVFDGFVYNIRYVQESDPSVDVFPPETKTTWAEQQVVWAKKDPNRIYYPVNAMGTAQESQIITMDPNAPVDVVFLYRPYTIVDYTEKSILLDSPTPGTVVHNMTFSGRAGETVVHTDTRGMIEHNGVKYGYEGTLPGNIHSKTISTGDSPFELVRVYRRYREVTFEAGTNGALGTNAPLFQDVPHNSPWSAITVPTPIPNSGYYFAGWNPGATFPTSVLVDVTYTAQFVKIDDLIITADSSTITYDGVEHTIAPSSFTYDVFGVTPQPNLTITGITLPGISGTNAGTYQNVIGNKNNIAIWDNDLNIDVTERYASQFIDGSLVINQRPLAVKPQDEDVFYNGLYQTATKPVDVQGLAAGHTVQAPIIGGGTITGAPYTLSILLNTVQVFDSLYNNVTGNYAITVDTALLTIKQRTAGQLIPLKIQPGNVTVEFTGSLMTESTTVGSILIDGTYVNPGYTPPSNTVVTFKATGSATVVGTHNVLAVVTSGADCWTVFVEGADMSANYVLTPALSGDLIIEQSTAGIPIVITPDPITRDYNGTKQTVTVTDGTFEVDGTTYVGLAALKAATGLDVTFTATAAETLPGYYKTTITSLIIEMNGVDISDSYFKTRNQGDFTILPLGAGNEIPLEITLAEVTRPFNGDPQTATITQRDAGLYEVHVDTVEISALNAANNNSLTVEFTATGTGQLPNTTTGYPVAIADLSAVVVKMNGTVVTQNYDISQVANILKITPLTDNARIPITIKAPDHKVPYTAVPYGPTTQLDNTTGHRVSVTAGKLPGGSTVEDVQFSAHTTPLANGQYPTDCFVNNPSTELRRVYSGNIELDPTSIRIFGQNMNDGVMVDLTSNYLIQTAPNDLTIEKVDMDLQITIGDIVKAYTGQPLNVAPSELSFTPLLTKGPADAWKPSYRIEAVSLTYDKNVMLPGNYANWISMPVTGIRIIDPTTNRDISGLFKITVVPGSVEIHAPDGSAQFPYLPLTIRPAHGSLPFTGFPVTYTTTAGEVVTGAVPPGASILTNAKGEALTVGEHQEVVEFLSQTTKITYTERGQTVDLTSFYVITLQKGNFTITPPTTPVPIILTALDKSLPFRPQGYYGDLPESRVGVTGTFGDGSALLPNYDISGTIAYAEGTDPGANNKTIVATPKILIDGQDHTAYFAVTRVPGKFTITAGLARDIQIKVWPEDRTIDYNTRDRVEQTGFKEAQLVSGGALPDMTVSLTATGKGNLPGTYDVIIDTLGATPNVKIMQRVRNADPNPDGSYGYTMTDLTKWYEIIPQKGKLTINKVMIPINVSVVTQPELMYNKKSQGTWKTLSVSDTSGKPKTINGYETNFTVGGNFSFLNQSELTVYVQGKEEGVNAGTYAIPAQGNVRIYGKVAGVLTDITGFFTITSSPGEFTINPYKLEGTIWAPDSPVDTYVYGDDILIPPTNYDLNDVNWLPGDEARKILEWIIRLESEGILDAGTYSMLTELIWSDPNYDISGLVFMPSDKSFVIKKAPLTVKPYDTEREQREKNPAFTYEIDGLKYNQTLEGIGFDLSDISYQAQEGNVPIGTWIPIINGQGPNDLKNYEVIYLNNDQPGHGVQVYAQVNVYLNYPNGRQELYVRPEKLYSPGDATIVGRPEDYGFPMYEYYRFDYWVFTTNGEMYWEGMPIGNDTMDVYAHWTQLYKLTIRHIRTDDGTEIAPPDILWLAEEDLHTFVPVELEGFTPQAAVYAYGDEEFATSPEGMMIMPADMVEAYIEYDAPAGMMAPPEEGENDNEKNGDGTDDSLYSYSIYDDFLPLAGMGPRNIGVCFD